MLNDRRREGRVVLLNAAVLACLACAQPKEGVVTRQPAVAGQFYPGDAKSLTAMIDSMLGAADVPTLPGRLVGIQVPHAGYPYSGPTAAVAFKLLQGRRGLTVVMLGTSHRARLDKAAVYARGSWRTPLGDVKIDEELARSILKEDGLFAELPEAHAQEHSVEVQVPFLQRTLSDFRIVPIMFLQPDAEECERAGRAIARAVSGKDVLLLASSDLYHGYSYTEAKKSDSATVGYLLKFDPGGLVHGLETGQAFACGGHPIAVLMTSAEVLGADASLLLAQTNSNDVMNERGGYVVGYSAVAFVQSRRDEADAGGEESDELAEGEQKSLLRIARRTLDTYVRTGKVPPAEPATARLSEKRGAFVTLHERGDLRGCIGYVEAVKPLYLAVSEMAVAAATEDPRFARVEAGELGAIDIEITVLSPLRPLASPDSVVVGKHGLVIRKGFSSGLLLPQVPTEQGWNREQFLQHTCLKAGLPPNAYKDKDARLYCFTGQVFGEKALGRQK
jgi:AmmeMemoRadiSam system protein B/AmmeMemoRadiSam system protein A